MSVFDQIISKAKDVADVAGRKATEAAELGKLKLQSAQLNSDLSKAFEELGQTVYMAKTGSVNCDEAVEKSVAQITSLKSAIREIAEKIAESKNLVLCPNCGEKNPADAFYCSRCGSALTKKAEEEPECSEKACEECQKCCEKPCEPVEKTLEEACDSVEEAAESVADKVEEAAEKAEDKAECAGKKLEQKMADLSDKAEEVFANAKDVVEEKAEVVIDRVKDLAEDVKEKFKKD